MSFNTDQRWPHFEDDGLKFMLTVQEGDLGTDIVLLVLNGAVWEGWGGTPDATGMLVEDVTDAKILAHGTLREFIVWCTAEAKKHAAKKAAVPLPDPNNRLARLKYNILMNVDNDTLSVKPGPLP